MHHVQRPRGAAWATHHVQSLHALYVRGMTLTEVGEQTGISAERVRQLFARHNLPMRSPAQALAVRRRRRLALIEELADGLRQGGTVSICAKRLDLDPAWAEAMLRRHAPGLLPPRIAPGHRVAAGYWTPERVVDAIRRWAACYGGPPRSTDWTPAAARALGDETRARRFARGLWPHYSTVTRRFGTWNSAIEAAGFEPFPAGAGRVKPRRSAVGDGASTGLRGAAR